ncbi:signal peptidase I SipW [Gracilibacillus marinus]|uniref:Signal peptidase I n=1 Tax=Gracilibacillus marinus TaxID=630535 RepID=A0ABV8VVG8_9BACI
MKRKKNKPIRQLLSNIVTTLLFGLFITLAIFIIVTRIQGGTPQLFGNELKVVLSGSMEPTFQTGSIIAVKPYTDQELKKDDIITFVDESERVITHRIIEVVENNAHTMYQTKGDNNNGADRDLVRQENVVGIYSHFTIPYVGYLVHYMQSPLGSALLLIIPGVFLLGYGVYTMWSIILEMDRRTKELTKEVTEES